MSAVVDADAVVGFPTKTAADNNVAGAAVGADDSDAV